MPAADAGRFVRPAEPVLPPAEIDVELPYFGEPVIADRDIDLGLNQLDVHLNIDTTGSFGGEIAELRESLTSTVVPALQERIPNLAMGVSTFEDYPIGDFGSTDDVPFELVQEITTDIPQVRRALERITLGSGGDLLEAGYESLYQIATGEGHRFGGHTYIDDYTGDGLGGVGFRENAVHAVVHITDAPSHTPASYEPLVSGTHNYGEVVSAFERIPAYVLGVSSGAAPRAELEGLARSSGAVFPAIGDECPTGLDGDLVPAGEDGNCALVYEIDTDGNGLGEALVDGINGLIDSVTYDEVHAEVIDDGFRFVRAVVTNGATAAPGVNLPGEDDLRPMDGENDTFLNVRLGVSISFRIRLRNDTLPPADYDQVFLITVRILGDGDIIREVPIRVRVPRGRLDGGRVRTDGGVASDAGEADAGAMDAAAETDAAVDAAVVDAAVVDAATETDAGPPADAAETDAG